MEAMVCALGETSLEVSSVVRRASPANISEKFSTFCVLKVEILMVSKALHPANIEAMLETFCVLNLERSGAATAPVAFLAKPAKVPSMLVTALVSRFARFTIVALEAGILENQYAIESGL